MLRICSRLSCSNAVRPASHTLSLHDALPIFVGDDGNPEDHRLLEGHAEALVLGEAEEEVGQPVEAVEVVVVHLYGFYRRSEEHTSELQSRLHLVCRLLLEKKNTITLLHTIQQ